MNYLQTIGVSLVSALIGGLITFGVVTFNPGFTPAVSQASENNKPNQSSNSSTEKELFKSLDQYQQNMKNQFDSFFDDDFFNQDDPFEAMRNFRQRMQEDIQEFSSPSRSAPFDSWFGQKFGGGTVEDIEKREDNNFVYYDIKVKNVKGTTVDTKIENGYLTITGQVESSKLQENEDANYSNRSLYSSTFSRTFPLPENVDENGMQMESEENKIVIKFPKTQN